MSSSSSSDEDMVLDYESGVVKNLPKLSKELYKKAYKEFMAWRSMKELDSFSEEVFMKYFEELSKKYRSSTLWSIYSMLVATMQIKHSVNIKNFVKITPMLKKLHDGFVKKRSKVFRLRDIEIFLNEADDDDYLAVKVALIFGIKGACHIGDFTSITVDDIQLHDKLLYVTLSDIRSKPERMFVVSDNYADIVKKYQACRPKNLFTKRFFLSYKSGKCIDQVIGKNKFTNMPRQIATYLQLPNPERYTGHCFRRTSLTHKLDSVTTLTQCFIQKSATVADDVPNHSPQPSSEALPSTSKESAQISISKLSNEESQSCDQTASNGKPTITWEYDISMSPPQSSKEEKQDTVCAAQPSSKETPKPMSVKHEPAQTQHYRGRAILSGVKHTIINVPGKSVTVTINNCSNFNVKLRQNE